MTIVHKTTDYGQFKFFQTRNRPVLTDKVYESVKENNKLEYSPILITKDKYVIDGQHRLDAARRLQVPIYYTIDPLATIEDIALYQKQTQWTMKDYLNFYKYINKDYEFVQNICETYDLFHSLTFVISFCSTSETPTSDFKAGTYKIKKSYSFLDTCFANLKQLIDKAKEIYSHAYLPKNALAALMSVISSKDYSHKTFLHKLDIYPDNILKILKLREFKNLREGFLDLYNFNTKLAAKKISLAVGNG